MKQYIGGVCMCGFVGMCLDLTGQDFRYVLGVPVAIFLFALAMEMLHE